MNVKANKQANVENQAVNLLSKEELFKQIEGVEKELKSYTWRELETNCKFAKNDKLSFITDDMLIVGCDIGSETHYIRAIDIRGTELSRKAFEFSNTAEGFEAAKAWILELTEDRIRNINRLHRELKIYFPEYMDAFGKIDGTFALEVLKVSCIPSEITELGTEGLRNIWHEVKLRGCGYSRASEIVEYAENILEIKGMGENILAGIEAEM